MNKLGPACGIMMRLAIMASMMVSEMFVFCDSRLAWATHDGICHSDTKHASCVINAPTNTSESFQQGWFSHRKIEFQLTLKEPILLVENFFRRQTSISGGVGIVKSSIIFNIEGWQVLDELTNSIIAEGIGPMGEFSMDHGGFVTIISFVRGFFTEERAVEGKADPQLVPTSVVSNEFLPNIFVVPWCRALNLELVKDPNASDTEHPEELRPRNSDPADPANINSKVRLRMVGANAPVLAQVAIWAEADPDNTGGHEMQFHDPIRSARTP